ncbi:hypothetical protein DHEL01_v208537 [Diaporthe helianthi]|uniref:Uncharacterized protein n=1 Tax=Diaporthe helianthi TaxID=158607 RepID=A0A2P5HS34_DIAHE|nr:hypothetical protein DHEL01_v208537 [Diaporthe helianthi]
MFCCLLPAACSRSWLIGELNELISVTRVRSAPGTRSNATTWASILQARTQPHPFSFLAELGQFSSASDGMKMVVARDWIDRLQQDHGVGDSVAHHAQQEDLGQAVKRQGQAAVLRSSPDELAHTRLNSKAPPGAWYHLVLTVSTNQFS